MWNKYVRFIFILALIGSFVACKSTKQVSGKTALITGISVNNVLMNQAQIKTIDASRVNFAIPIQNQSTVLKGFIKARVDSCVQVSLQALFGIEVVRMHLTQDSIFILDRINQRYVAEAFETLTAQAPIDFFQLQGLLLNRIVDTEKRGKVLPFSYAKEENMHLLSYENSNFALQYVVNDIFQVLRTTLSDTTRSKYLMAEYDQFEPSNSVLYPRKTKLMLMFGAQQYAVDYTLEKVEFNTPLELSLSIPARYKRVVLLDIAKEFSK